MPPLHLLQVLTVLACASRVATETVVSRAGKRAVLPCHAMEDRWAGVEVCWGKGRPRLFSCQNTLLSSGWKGVTYRKSHRYNVQSMWSGDVASLSISKVQPSDAGFYHCRVQLPGLFNDQTFMVHLIVIPAVVPSSTSGNGKAQSTTIARCQSGEGTEQTGSDVTAVTSTEPVIERVELHAHPETSLQAFIGQTIRSSFIIFIPAVLLSAAYKAWRSNRGAESNSGPDQSEREEEVSI